MDMTESQYSLSIDEEELGVFIRVYRSLKDSFRSRTRMVLLHIDEDMWEFRAIGLTSREWLEFCANIYAELPNETVELVNENSDPDVEIPEQFEPHGADTLTGEAEEAPPEEEAEEDEGYEEESAEAVQRKLRKPIVVRRTATPNVTVEEG